MVLTLSRSPSGPAATVAAATPTKRRRSKSGGFDISFLLSPSSTRRRTAGQNPARHHDPHQADDGPDEPRIGAVRGDHEVRVVGVVLRGVTKDLRSEEHTSELQSQSNLVCRLL